MSAVSERDVEARFVRCADRRRGWAVKLVSPGNAGMPDRLAVMPDGTMRLVELKAPGKRPRPLQERMFARLAAKGHPVEVIDSLERAEAFWAEAAS